MLRAPMLPALPPHAVLVVEERPSLDPPGFLRLRRVTLKIRFASGNESEPFTYDMVHRERFDAVVIVPHYQGPNGERRVILRSSIRPPVALRPHDPHGEGGSFWEVPAGLVEADERSPEGLRRCAARELFEEVGARAPEASFEPLGSAVFPASGVLGERHHFFHVEVDPRAIEAPAEDGSALERHAVIASVAVPDALAMIRRGELSDGKTEIAVRRLAERFA